MLVWIGSEDLTAISKVKIEESFQRLFKDNTPDRKLLESIKELNSPQARHGRALFQ
jgi:hypothetical protein